MLQRGSRVVRLVEPRLPSPAKAPPSGPDWLHEIKHDGFRIMARRDAKGVRLITRNGNDFAKRFLLVVASVMSLPVRSCLIDGEAIVALQRTTCQMLLAGPICMISTAGGVVTSGPPGPVSVRAT